MTENDIGAIALLIPLISGAIGWGTNWLAIRMMFKPVQFVGIRPFLGWQGIVPAQTEVLSKKLSRLIHEELIDIQELFAEIQDDSLFISVKLNPIINKITDLVIKEISTNYAPEKWQASGAMVQGQVKTGIRSSVRALTREIMEEIGQDPNKVVDLDMIIHGAMVKDRGLLGHLIMSIAAPELKFIERSGLWFGALFGLLQMLIWILFPEQWVLPVGGFLVGYVTNYLAITLLFEPHTPVRFGPWEFQEIFIKRQTEVAKKFADVVMGSILTAENMLRELSQGETKQAMMATVEKQVGSTLDKQQSNPILAHLFGKEMIQEARADLVDRMKNVDPANIKDETLDKLIADQSEKLHQQINGKLQTLQPDEFSGILRPVFKADEWKLFIVGGILGTAAGVFQAVYLFADYML